MEALWHCQENHQTIFCRRVRTLVVNTKSSAAHSACRASLRLPKETKYETSVLGRAGPLEDRSGLEKSDLEKNRFYSALNMQLTLDTLASLCY